MRIHRVIALAVLLAATVGAAHAAPTITDRAYWPNEARTFSQSSAFDAQARFDEGPIAATRSCVYQGGPKLGALICR